MRAKRVIFSNQQQSRDEIAEHRQLLEQATKGYFLHRSEHFYQRFAVASRTEVNEALAETLREIDRASLLALLAAIEAAFRVDYLERVYKKRKDPVSRVCRKIYKEKAHRVSLTEDLFSLWRNHGSASPRFIEDLQGAFQVRHWLAHGRYWSPRLGKYDDFDTVYSHFT